ncbi:MAG: efflux RND transporter periplasmic adaptor subunit [Bacteroidia bacterium]
MAFVSKLKPLHWLLIVLGLLLVLAIVGKKAGWIGQRGITKISTEVVEKRLIVESVLANGKIQPEVEVKMSSEISGEVIGLFVSEGDSVMKGQLLARINPELILAAMDRNEAAINNARAQLASARARLNQLKANFDNNIKPNYERNERLVKEKVISQAEYEGSKANYEAFLQEMEAGRQSIIAAEFTVKSTEATQKETREQLLRTNIYAPIDGIVTRLAVEVGERVVGTIQMAGTEMMRIANLNQMEARVDVSESDVVRVKIGDSVLIDVDAYPGRQFRGLVREIANSSNAGLAAGADQVTNFGVKISLINASYADLTAERGFPFRPGMSSSVEILTKRVNDALSVPITSVTVRAFDESGKIKSGRKRANRETDAEDEQKTSSRDELREVVFVYSEGKVDAKEVKTGIQDDRYIQVLSGLEAGEEVVEAPFSAISKLLKDGQTVQKVKKEQLFSK